MKRCNRNTGRKRRIALFLVLVLSISLLYPAAVYGAETDGNTIHIQTQEDLKTLAENCRLDTWSQGKTVILDNNLELDEKAEAFLPIPTFGGTFEGNNYKITGLSMGSDASKAGLFDTIQAGGTVNRLTVAGQVTPREGDTIGGFVGRNYGKLTDCGFEGTVQGKVSVGGLAGINETSGQLVNCRFQGTVLGEHYVGGITGQNTGSLVQCENKGDINTTVIEAGTDFSDLSVLGTTESLPAGTDIGGIAGFSNGIVQSCRNTGKVGYEHMGYNVGGILGRQSGYLDSCSNSGSVQGRKDVGGIAGQLEPQVTLRYQEDILDKLWTELDTLQSMTNEAAASAEAVSGSLSGSMDSLITDVSAAKEAVNGLSSAMSDWGEEGIEQINDISARIAWVVSQSQQVMDTISNASGSWEEIASLLQQAGENATGTGEQGKEAAEELALAAECVQNGTICGQNSVNHIHTALELAQSILNGEEAGASVQGVLDELNAGITEAQNAKSALEEARSHVENAKVYLEALGEPGSDVLDELTQIADQLSPAVSSIEEAMNQIGEISQTLAEEPAVSFTPVDSNVSSQGEALDAALSQMISNASGLHTSLAASSDALLEDFRGINNQITVIANLLQQNLEEAQNQEAGDSFEDVSDQDMGEPASGKIYGARNSGEVRGDVNVAGIAGSLSVEYDFDPEDDLTQEGSRSLDFQYKTLAVVAECTNEGEISAKKNYAGGIVGRMDLGAVKACESYGKVESTSGDYVGGIAGLSRGTIRNSFAKTTLAGGDYIGGITGFSEENSVVSGCYTLVEIQECKGCYGAVSGGETGEFSGNYYVSDTLAGLGPISYAGKAEPISFSALAQTQGIPEKMTQFTLRFFVEEEEIKSQTFSYGDSFGQEVFPEIPVEDGYYGFWDTEELKELHFDKTVNAEYSRYVLTLPSEATRESGRPVFLMEGNFDDSAALNVSEVEKPERVKGKKPVEQWQLQCSDTDQKTYKIRYLSPEETGEGYSVYVKEDGRWKKASCSTFGSYLVFSATSAQTEAAVISSSSMWIQRLLIGFGLLLLLALLLGAVRKRPWKKEKTKESLHTGSKQWKIRTAVLKSAVRKRRKVLIIAGSFVLFLGIALVIFLGSRLRPAGDVYKLLQDFTESPEYAVSLSVDTELDEQINSGEIDMVKTQLENQAVICIQKDGISLYYAEGALIMENGKAYKISNDYPDYSMLLKEAGKIFKTLSFSTDREGEEVTYQLTAEGENAETLLKLLLPEQEENISAAQKVTVTLTASQGQLDSLHFDSKGTLEDEAKTPYSISAELRPEEMEKGFSLPQPVKETVSSGKIEGQSPVSEDLFRLLSAWTDLSQEESFAADLNLGVDWGPISLNEKLKYEQTSAEGKRISSLRKDDFILYFSEGIFCDQKGTVLTAEETELSQQVRLLEVIYQICLKGEFDCTDTGKESWLYTLTLDEEAMKSVAYAAAPEIESMNVALNSGNVEILVDKGIITEITCSCTGGLKSLEEAAPATVKMDMVFTPDSGFEIPARVEEQLIQEGEVENAK